MSSPIPMPMKFVTTNTADHLDLQALHRVRERPSRAPYVQILYPGFFAR